MPDAPRPKSRTKPKPKPRSGAKSQAKSQETSKAKSPLKRRPAQVRTPSSYHHGDLRRVLIDAAFQLVEEGGVDHLSMREAARRAGVSPGAPFRHFESREALITAVAIEAQRRFRAEIDAALAEAPRSDPLARFRGFGIAYLRWAMRNPAHFEIISSGRLFDHDGSAELSRDNAELIGMVGRTLAEAFAQGQLRVAELDRVQIAARSLVYGFARMNIDGHLPRWGVSAANAGPMAEAVLDLFIDGIARRPRKS